MSPITDFFVIGTGSSGRQMRSVADEIEEMGRAQGSRPLGRHGHEGELWLLTDFVDVVVHLFSPEARGYYDLDGLWGDALVVDWQTGAPPPPNARPPVDPDAGVFARPPAATADEFDDDGEDDFGDEDDEGDDAEDESDDAVVDDDDDAPTA